VVLDRKYIGYDKEGTEYIGYDKEGTEYIGYTPGRSAAVNAEPILSGENLCCRLHHCYSTITERSRNGYSTATVMVLLQNTNGTEL